MRSVILVTGVCHRDVELATLWLRWVSFLCRQIGGDNREKALLVVHTKRVVGEQLASLTSAVGDSYSGMFQTRIEECPDEDEAGYPRSASHLFLRTLETAERLHPGSAVLWCEPDTVPMKPTWFTEIAEEYIACGKPFLGMKVGAKFPHLSGNSCYPHNWRELAPSIAAVLDAPDYKLWGPGKGQPWDVYCRNETTPQMAESSLMEQRWKERDVKATRLKEIRPETCLFHQDKTGALIREIAIARYPTFMDNLNDGRKFYVLNGHPSRLKMKGFPIKFTHSKWAVGGWTSAVCSGELSEEHASAMALMVGRLGVREIPEVEFLRITGRKAADLPAPRVSLVEKERPVGVSHPSVFVMLGRYGDICNILPMLKAEADAGRRPTLVIAQEFADILDGVSYVDRIVWDGAYDRLSDALRWLKRDKGIPAPVVVQFHRHPTDKARLTDSYQREVWRLAGRLKDFDARGPLVFDRRDEKREKEYVSRFDVCTKPLLLVGLESVSSPLQATNAIISEIIHGFQKTHAIVDLSDVPHAARIYDLIGLLDRAALLLTADTSFLHLARASKVPVVALLNDGWRGSVPHPGVSSLRYNAAHPGAVLKAVEDALSPLISVSELAQIIKRGQEIYGPKIFHVVDMHREEDDRTTRAIKTWSGAYKDGVTPAHTRYYLRDAKEAMKDPRHLPFFKDVLRRAIDESKNPADIVIWSNSDIGFVPGMAKVIADHVSTHGAASMRRTESNGKGHPGRDLFAFTVKWLRGHWEEFPDYVLGAPVFDLGVTAMIRKFHRLPCSLKNMGQDMHPADMPPGFALHESHAPAWDVPNADSVPSIRHNKKAFRVWAKKYAPEIAFSKGGNFL